MALVTKTVDKTLVNGSEVFIYTINVSYSGLVQPAQNGYLIDFFPSKILFALPQVGGQLQSITQTPVLGGTNVSFNFGQVNAGTSLSFTVGCSFGPGRVDNDSFTNIVNLFADGVNVATGTAPTVNLVLDAQFRLSKTATDASLVRPGDERTIVLTLLNEADYGASINNVVINDILPAGLSPVLAFTPIGHDFPVNGYSDPTYNNRLGSWIGNTMNFTLPSFHGAMYTITFKVTVDNDVLPGQIITNIANWSIDGVAQADALYVFKVFSPQDAFSLGKSGTRTGTIGSPVSYLIVNANQDNVTHTNYVLEDSLPLELDISELKFTSGVAGIPSYSILYSLRSAPNVYIPLLTNVSGNTGTINLLPLIPPNDGIAKIKVTAPSILPGNISAHSLQLLGTINNTAIIGQSIINSVTASADGGILITSNWDTLVNGQSDLSVAKSISPELPAYFPLEEFTIAVVGSTPNTITINPVLADLMPIGVLYEQDSEYFRYTDNFNSVTYDSRLAGFPVPLPTREIIPNFAGTGKTLLRWSFDFIVPMGNTLGVYFKAFVEIDPPSSFENIGFEGNPGDNVLFVYNSIADVNDYDGDGITDENISSVSVSGLVLTTSEFSLKKLVKGARDLDFSPVGTSVSGGSADYQLLVTNNQDIDLRNIEIVDILPYVGDTGVILTNTPRGSQFIVYATGAVEAQVVNLIGNPVDPNPDIVIEYSTSNDPMRFDQFGNPIGTGVFTLTPPADITTLRSIKVTTGPNFLLKPYDRLIVTIKANVPVGVPLGQTAYDSFAVRANKIINGQPQPLLPTEPNKVPVTVVAATNGSIGQFVWEDYNGNGIYDAGEPGVNGITVQLYDSNMNLLLSTSTANNAMGQPGYYLFSNLPADDYFVKFTPYAPYTLTVQMAAAPNGSRPNQTTGITNLITLAANQNILDVNAGLIGLPCLPPVIYATDKCIYVGQIFDPLAGVTAVDCQGNDITSDIIITENTVNTAVPGLYYVTYSVTDSRNQTTTKRIEVFVCKVNERHQAISDLIQSIALQKTALAHILNAEGEKIQKAASLDFSSADLLSINDSVKDMIKTIVKLEMVLKAKLDIFDCSLCSKDCCGN